MSSSRRGILISGYYGCRNTGDEAVLAAMLLALRARGAEITVLSETPAETEAEQSVRAINRKSLCILWREMRGAQLLISGGGSLFQDATSVASVVFYFATLMLARLAGCPTMIYAQGVGPLRSRISRKLVRIGFNKARAITVRDKGSAGLLRKIGVMRPVEVTADPVFALEPAAVERARELLEAEGIPVTRFTAVALRPWAGIEGKLPAIAEALDRFSQESGGPTVFIPMQPARDFPLSEQAAAFMKTPATILMGCYSPSEAMAILGRAGIVVGMRLHALIFAAAQGIPIIGISYDPKVDELLGQLEVKAACTVEGITFGALSEQLRSVWQSREEESARLVELSAVLHEQALRNAEIAMRLL